MSSVSAVSQVRRARLVWDSLAMMVGSLLDRSSYLYAEADRLIGLPAGTARRWINGYERRGKIYAPILREHSRDTEWVTWGEFVEARMLAEFRSEQVPTAQLRAAVERLRDEFQVAYPLAHLRPYLAAQDGNLLIEDGPLSGRRVLATGQRILEAGSPVMMTAAVADDDRGEAVVVELPLDPEYPSIKTNPDRLSGQPTIEGRRVAVATVAGMVAAGEPRESVAAAYGVSIADVDGAVGYARKYGLVA